MNILLGVHQFFPLYYAGTERFALNLARQLQRMGHAPVVATYAVAEDLAGAATGAGAMLWRRERYAGVPVLKIAHRNLTEAHGRRLGFDVFDQRTRAFFQEYLVAQGIDLVHLAHPMRIASLAEAARDTGRPLVLTLTDFWTLCPRVQMIRDDLQLCRDPAGGQHCAGPACLPEYGQAGHQARFAAARRLLTLADRRLSPSAFLAERVAALSHLPVEVIRHGLDYRDLDQVPARPPGATVTLGYTGTLLRHKGVDVLVRAMTQTSAENLRLVIHGPSFHEPDYEAHLKELARDDLRIRFAGEYRHEDLPTLMRRFDYTVTPSLWWENSPLTILTSLAWGVPVIASNLGGMAEFVQDEVNGLLFPTGDVAALAARLQRVAAEPALAARLRAGIRRPPRIEDEAFAYETLYRTLAAA
jgi:glycosyltransferase involved in cell wall biosynthesis